MRHMATGANTERSQRVRDTVPGNALCVYGCVCFSGAVQSVSRSFNSHRACRADARC